MKDHDSMALDRFEKDRLIKRGKALEAGCFLMPDTGAWWLTAYECPMCESTFAKYNPHDRDEPKRCPFCRWEATPNATLEETGG